MHIEEYKNEEMKFLNNFDINNYLPLQEVPKKIGLDYFAIDFGIDANNNIIIFEINSCGKLIGSRKIKEHEPVVNKILNEIKNMFNYLFE